MPYKLVSIPCITSDLIRISKEGIYECKNLPDKRWPSYAYGEITISHLSLMLRNTTFDEQCNEKFNLYSKTKRAVSLEDNY